MLARVFATATCLSVRLSHSGMCLAERKRIVKCTPSDSPITLVSGEVWFIEKFARGHPKGTCKMRVAWVFFRRFSTNMSSYLENGAFYTLSYYRTVIGNHMQAIEWCHFRWSWVTPHPRFKVTVVLKGEYLQSDAFYRHSYYIGRNRTP